MKILMINKFLYPAGGAETYMFELGNYWKDHGDKVEYFGMRHTDNIVGNQWGIYTDSVDFRKKGFDSKVKNPLKVIYSFEAKRKMRDILKLFEPDVIHINNFNYQLTPSILLAIKEYKKIIKKKIRVIYIAHDSQLVCPNHYMYTPSTHQVCSKCLGGSFLNCVKGKCIHESFMKSVLGAMEAIYWNRRKIYTNIDVILCPSHFMKRMLDTNVILRNRTVMLRNFVSYSERSVKTETNRRYVLYFGRYSEEKGIPALLEICKELSEIPFIFAGGGPLENKVNETECVKNLGFLKGEELRSVIRNARFSVCLSECNENCPFSIMESMIQGTPVLGTDRGGISELITERSTGWLFSGGNKEQLKIYIREIWNSNEPEIFRKDCEMKTFDTLEKYGEKLKKIYEG